MQTEVALFLNHIIEVWFVPSCYSNLASSTHLHCFDGINIHPYGHPLHGNVLKHVIYTLDGSVVQSEVDICQPCHSGMVCTQLLPKFSQFYPPQ